MFLIYNLIVNVERKDFWVQDRMTTPFNQGKSATLYTPFHYHNKSHEKKVERQRRKLLFCHKQPQFFVKYSNTE